MDEKYFTISYNGPVRNIDGVTQDRVQLSGEFDLGACDELRETLISILDAGASTTIIIDLDAVTFIDSEAIGAIIDGYTAALRSGIGFHLVNVHGIVRRVFEVIGMAALFEPVEASGTPPTRS